MSKLKMPIIDYDALIAKKRPSSSRLKINKKDAKLYEFVKDRWRGDAHVHSIASTRLSFGHLEAIYDIGEIIDFYDKLSLDFIVITDHSSNPSSPKKLLANDAISRSILKSAERIKKINAQEEGILVLSGVECNIMFDKNKKAIVDLPNSVLKKLDLVLASRHKIAHEKNPEKIKESLMAAIVNPCVDVIGHPDRNTRRKYFASDKYWKKYWNMWPEILSAMEKHKTAFEINLNTPPVSNLLGMAINYNINFFVNFDLHDFDRYKKAQTLIAKQGREAKKRWAKGHMHKDDVDILKKYKMAMLSRGLGVEVVKVLARMLKKLDSLGVSDQRIINSSKERLLEFLQKDRKKKLT